MKSLSELVQQHNPVEFEAENRDKEAKRFIALVLDATKVSDIDVTEADFQAIARNLRRYGYFRVFLLLCVFCVIQIQFDSLFPNIQPLVYTAIFIAFWIVTLICVFVVKRELVDDQLARLRIQKIKPD